MEAVGKINTRTVEGAIKGLAAIAALSDLLETAPIKDSTLPADFKAAVMSWKNALKWLLAKVQADLKGGIRAGANSERDPKANRLEREVLSIRSDVRDIEKVLPKKKGDPVAPAILTTAKADDVKLDKACDLVTKKIAGKDTEAGMRKYLAKHFSGSDTRFGPLFIPIWPVSRRWGFSFSGHPPLSVCRDCAGQRGPRALRYQRSIPAGRYSQP